VSEADECRCEFDPYDDDPDEESWHYRRTCGGCGYVWWGLHCPHDGVQNPCPSCGWRQPGTRTPMEVWTGRGGATVMSETPTGMCPHCGAVVAVSDGHLTDYHDWPKPTRQVCPGSKQIPRCAESDARPLWNGKPNLLFAGRGRGESDEGN
jgi:hypothetical protein